MTKKQNSKSGSADTQRTKRICPNGHTYYKSSECPVCPICANESKPANSFLSDLSAPARRALESNGITELSELAKYSEKIILSFHGMGPASLPKLRQALNEVGLDFKKE